ncbi:MAG: methyltransferase domain-containing protein [Flavobacteriales bacterium]|nr:methyltransferase domain-containing protein [Flavobacteriales bacterium]
MFFPERITGLKPTDKVLDVGPGASPHPRADVLLELAYDDQQEYFRQLGHDQPLVTDKQVVYYDGSRFPFADGSFDYVICSHVLEHVPDVPGFLSEVFRVAKRGYFEYPLAYYDLIYNIDAHLNFLKWSPEGMRYMKQADSALDDFRPLQRLMRDTLAAGHTGLVNDLMHLFMEGVQWEKPFAAIPVHRIDDVCHVDFTIPPANGPDLGSVGGKALAGALLNTVKRKVGIR